MGDDRRQPARPLLPPDPRRAARLRFGNPAALLEDSVDAWGWRWLDDLAQDVRYALRGFARHAGFTITAVLSLALGIGANAAIVSVVNGLVLRPLPFADPSRLVAIYGSSRLMPQHDNVSNLNDVRQQSASFEAVAGYEVYARYMPRGGGAERVMSVRVERDFFPVLRVAPLAGRTFDGPLADAVVGVSVSRPLFLLLAAVALVLALACANIANLLFVRVTLRYREVAVRAGLGAGPLRTSRSREFAVRIALGADRRRVAAAVLRHGATLTAVGLLAGVALAAAATPLLRNLPVTVRPPDAFVVAPLLAALAAATIAACLLPALRAARADPMSVLRNE